MANKCVGDRNGKKIVNPKGLEIPILQRIAISWRGGGTSPPGKERALYKSSIKKGTGSTCVPRGYKMGGGETRVKREKNN